MRNKFSKTLFIVLGGFLFFIAVPTVDAAEFKIHKSKNDITRESNLTKIPVSIVLGENETINTNESFVLSCETNHTDVLCEVKLTDNNNFIEQDGSFWYHVEGSPLTTGEHRVAEIVLTNNLTSKNDDVEVKNIKGSIKNVEKTVEGFNTSVGAKSEDKPLSTDPYLKAMEVSVGTISPEFNKDVFEYTIYGIKDTIGKIKFTPTCNDEGTCSFGKPSGGKSVEGTTVSLNIGENKIVFDVTSECGNYTQAYVFNVIRGETAYNSARLSELSFDTYSLNPEFDPDVTKYVITVPNQVTTLSQIIKYTAEDENAKEKIEVKGLDNLAVGENKITIAVTNVNEDKTVTYEVVATRLSEENIEILIYINNEITFKDSDGIQTTLKAEEFEKLYPNEYKKIINNEYKFDEDGNKIIEALEDDEKDEKDDDKKDGNNKIWIIVALIVVGLIVIVVSGILIFRKKKPEEELLDKDFDAAPVDSSDDATEIDEEGVEENIVGRDFSKDMEATVDVDEALNDLMNTKQYNFREELEEKLKDEE